MTPPFVTCPYEIQFCGWMADIWPWIQHENTPFWRLYWNVTAGGVLEYCGREIAMRPDRFYLIPASLPFSTRAVNPFEQFFIHFNFIDSLEVHLEQILELPGDRISAKYVAEFIGLFQGRRNRLRCDQIGHVVLGHALLKCEDRLAMTELPTDPRIRNILGFISRHLGEPLDNERLARHAGLCRNAFVRLFSGMMHESPQAFVRRKRMERACYLLRFSNMNIKEIASELGFADQYHFSKVFGRLWHNTPSHFRYSHANFMEKSMSRKK